MNETSNKSLQLYLIFMNTCILNYEQTTEVRSNKGRI